MDGLDTDLMSIRFAEPVLKLLKNADITSVERLIANEQLLAEVRTHLKPIQQVKLNNLIKERDKSIDTGNDNGDELVVRVSRKSLRRERDLEQQCVEELSYLADAPEVVKRSVELHRARVKYINSLLKESESSAEASYREDSKSLTDGESAEHKHLIEKRATLLTRLADLCKYAAEYNAEAVQVSTRSRRWTQEKVLFDNNLNWCYYPGYKVSRTEQLEKRHRLNVEQNEIAIDERKLKYLADGIDKTVEVWNNEVIRLNTSLIGNSDSDSDSSYCMQVVMMAYSTTLKAGTVSLLTKHSHIILVVPGEHLDSYINRVQVAQRKRR